MTTSFDQQVLEPRVMFSANAVFDHRVLHLPRAGSSDVVDVLGDTAIFAGNFARDAKGAGPSTLVSDVYFYDAARRKWSTGKLSGRIGGMSETVVGDQMLLAGGYDYDPQRYTDAVNIYTARRHRWSTAKLSSARGEVAAVTVGDLALFAGGILDSGKSSDAVDIYNGGTGQWSTATLPVARRDIAAVTVGRLALFAGGIRQGAKASDEVDILDSKTRQWSVAHLSSAGYCIATSVGHYALFEHLRDSSILSGPGEVDVYDANRNTWSTVNMPDYLYNVQTVGKYAVFADGIEPGNGDLGVTSHNVHIFNSATGQWTTTQLQGGISNIGLSGVAGRYILFAGGEDDQGKETDKVYVLDADTGRWSTTGKLSVPHEGMDSFTIGKTAYFAGGWLDRFDSKTTDVVDEFTVEG